LNETVVVRAGEIYRSRVRGSNVGQVTFRRGSFWYHNGPYVYNVGDADPATRQLHDVEVYELNEQGRLVRSIEASRVEIGADGTWLLSNAVIRRFDPGHPAAAASHGPVARTQLVLHQEHGLLASGLDALSHP